MEQIYTLEEIERAFRKNHQVFWMPFDLDQFEEEQQLINEKWEVFLDLLNNSKAKDAKE